MKVHTPGIIIVFAAFMAILLAPGSTYGRVSLKERDALETSLEEIGENNYGIIL